MTDVDLTRGVYRRIYSGATKGRRINCVSVFAELLFWRLHLVADDFGTFEADPYLLKCAALPLRGEVEQQQIVGALNELVQARLVELYEVRSERYGKIVGFEEFQPAGKNGRRIRRYAPPATAGESKVIQGGPGESGCIRKIQASETETEAENQTDNKADAHQPAAEASAIVVEIPKELQTSAFQAAWDMWQQHRRQLRKKLTPLTAQRQLADLAAMGEARAMAAIHHSIKNGWIGIFEEKDGSEKSKRAAHRAGTPGGQFDERIELE